MMNEHIEQQQEKIIMSAQDGRIRRYVVEGEDGVERYISYDTQTTLTIVHDYAPGRSLIFKGNEMNTVLDNDLDEKLNDLNISVLVDNAELAQSSPLKLWNAMREAQVKR